MGCGRTAAARNLCKAHYKSWRLRNVPGEQDRQASQWKAWAETNREHLADAYRAYREENAGQVAAWLTEWKAANPWHASLYSFTKRRRARGLPQSVEDLVDPNVLYARDGGRCPICGDMIDMDIGWPAPLSATVDHIVPVSDPVSTHSYDNTQLTHWVCNQRKGSSQAA
jgi:5-methylcytosine-specific restriction endonuclease McrA